MKHNLTDIEFSGVSRVIATNMGLHFTPDRRAMLSQSMAEAAEELGFHNMKEFIQWFLTASLNKDQIEIIASYLTISETYFWREHRVFDALTQNILPELVTSKGDNIKKINIWCAGCSTGEEAYSIAIALCRTIPKIKDWKITILATDINPKALNKAKAGVYGPWSFRNTPPWLKDFYFTRINNREYEVIPEIKEMVTFSSFNLIQENYLSSICKNNKMDIIFCRNVLMYFTKDLMAKVSQNLFNALMKEGWLVVSSCELSSELFPQFIPANYPGAILYHKFKEEFPDSDTGSYDSNSRLLFNTSLSRSPDMELEQQLIHGKDFNNSILNNNDNYSLTLYQFMLWNLNPS
jgi:chemotaxis protein methyltransferase CheR